MLSLKALFATKITKTNVLRTVHGTPINREKGIKIIVFVLSPSSTKQVLLQESILKEFSKKKDSWVECFVKSVGGLKQRKNPPIISFYCDWFVYVCGWFLLHTWFGDKIRSTEVAEHLQGR